MTNEELLKGLRIYSTDLEAVPYSAQRERRGREAMAEVKEKLEKYSWHDLRKYPEDLPPNEHEVDIAYLGYKGIVKTARAIYEDGTMHSENSDFCYTDLDDWCEYCEETDDYIIPEGWIEANHFGENMGIVDRVVIAWREIEPFEEEE